MHSQTNGVTGNGSQQRFWEQFLVLIPEAARCRFLFNGMRTAAARAAEYRRESGPFLSAIESTHLPCAIQRLNKLKEDAEALVTFYKNDDHEIVYTQDRVDEALKIATRFETQIVTPLDEVVREKNEASARNVIKSLRKVATNIARYSEGCFTRAIDELEQAVANSVIWKSSSNGFVSCVSLDLAQYGNYAKTLHDLADAPGVFALNRKIQNEINTAVIGQNIPKEEVIVIDTGDGAIVIFTDRQLDRKSEVANRAYRFSTAFLNAINKGNDQIDPEHQLHFRIGICSGLIVMEKSQVRRSAISQCSAGGVPIGRAVRLQTAARTGEILACAATWKEFSPGIQELFDNECQVLGKIHEKTPIRAHRLECVAPRPEERPTQ